VKLKSAHPTIPSGPTAYEQLSYRRRRFVDAFCVTFNASEAYRLAGYQGQPNKLAPRLMANDGIRRAISERLTAAGLGPAEVNARIAAIARADMGEFWQLIPAPDADPDDPNCRKVPVPDWERICGMARDRTLSRVIKNIRITRDGVTIELYDQLRALEIAARIHGMFADTGDTQGDEHNEALERLADAMQQLTVRPRQPTPHFASVEEAGIWLEAHRDDDLLADPTDGGEAA
jgi:hypothetical protein